MYIRSPVMREKEWAPRWEEPFRNCLRSGEYDSQLENIYSSMEDMDSLLNDLNPGSCLLIFRNLFFQKKNFRKLRSVWT